MATTAKSLKRAALVAGGCAIVGVAAAASVQASIDDPQLVRAVAAPVDPALSSKFAAFRTVDLGQGEALKKVVLNEEGQADGRTAVPRIDFDRAKRTSVTNDLSGWLVPAGGKVCLVLEAGGSTSATACTDPARAEQGAATLLQVFPGENGAEKSAVLLTAVPDGANAPVIRNGRSTEHAPVDGNISKSVLGHGDVVELGEGRVIDVDLILARDQGLHAPKGFPSSPVPRP